MKNILILTQELYPNKIDGSAKVVSQQAKLLAEQNYKITIITNSNNNLDSEKNIKIINYPLKYKSKSINDLIFGKKTIKQTIDNNKFDLVIIHHPYLGKAFLKLKTKLPYIYMFHASTALETKWQGLDIVNNKKGLIKIFGKVIQPIFISHTKRIENELLIKAKQVWLFSKFSESLIKKHFPKTGHKIKIIPYWINLDTFKPTEKKNLLRQKFNITEKDIIAPTVRRLVPRMGLEWLINNWSNINKKYPNIKLLIIGDGYLKPELKQLIAEKKLGDKILLIGNLPEQTLIKYYQTADLFILPTIAYEGLGLATIEALACGLPVIGTNLGATPEIINQIDKYLLLQNFDSVALLNCLNYTMLNKKELSIKARQFCENNYNTTNSQTIIDLLENL